MDFKYKKFIALLIGLTISQLFLVSSAIADEKDSSLINSCKIEIKKNSPKKNNFSNELLCTTIIKYLKRALKIESKKNINSNQNDIITYKFKPKNNQKHTFNVFQLDRNLLSSLNPLTLSATGNSEIREFGALLLEKRPRKLYIHSLTWKKNVSFNSIELKTDLVNLLNKSKNRVFYLITYTSPRNTQVAISSNYSEPSPSVSPSSSEQPSPSPDQNTGVSPTPSPSPSNSASTSASPSSSPSSSPSPSPSQAPDSGEECNNPSEGAVIIDQNWLNNQNRTLNEPYYLDQANKTYLLKTNVNTEGTAFALIAQNITFNLCGYTITYNDALRRTIPNYSFELGTGNTPDNWDLSQAPNATRYQGIYLKNEVSHGNHSVRFSVPAEDQYIRSIEQVTLEPNTTYSLSAMFKYGGMPASANQNPGVTMYVRLANGLNTYQETTYSNTNWRGIQFAEKIFTTGENAESYSVEVGIIGASNVSTNNIFIDEIQIQKYRNYGLTVSARDNDEYPGFKRFGHAHGSTIKNGSIVQGQDGGTSSHGIYNYQANNTIFDNLNITVHGENSFILRNRSSANLLTKNCNFHHNTTTITSRDNMNGTSIYEYSGKFENNILHSCPQVGITTVIGSASQILNNTFKLTAKRYTNNFAIVLRGPGTVALGNTIICGQEQPGDYSCRGIGAGGHYAENLPRRMIKNNMILVETSDQNQEYAGVPIGGAYGIQIEDGSNISVENNFVQVNGRVGTGYAFRISKYPDSILVNNNIFRAVYMGHNVAPLRINTLNPESIRFWDNTLQTSGEGYAYMVGLADNAKIVFESSHIQVEEPWANTLIFEEGPNSAASLHSQFDFVDTTFHDQTSKNYFINAELRNYGGAKNITNRMSFSSGWTTNFHIKEENNTPLAFMEVEIRNQQSNLVFSGQTDQGGNIQTALKEFETIGNTKTSFNPYTISVIENNQVFCSKSFQVTEPNDITIICGN